MKKLTIKQEKFCHKYIESGNASEAYRFAYSCEGWKDSSVWEKSCVLLKNVNVQSRIEALKADLAAASDITKERVLAEYAKIAFCSIADFHNTWIDRKLFEQLTPIQKAAIKSIKTRVRKVMDNDREAIVEEVLIELYDKLKALDSVRDMLGFNAPEKHEITGKDGEPLHHTSELNDLPIDKLKAIKEIMSK